ncbi:MAG: AccI family restriction endonuclease [Prevotellaceae bacterium]|jgi:type II restriction enzyme|nr:AccI family restriction endonuclease [Prevotellaceae bacterium]
MNYFDRIRELTKDISVEMVDFSRLGDLSRTFTQASSYCMTEKKQDEWAEDLVTRAINKSSKNYVAVKYGKTADLIAGEEGFDAFFQELQNELDTIGKRPDLLIFNKSDFRANLGLDISHIPHEQITDYVKKAVAGVEVRSSAFLIDRYEKAKQMRTENLAKIAFEIKNKVLGEYREILDHPSRESYIEVLNGMTPRTLNRTDFKVPSWRSSESLIELSVLFKQLKIAIKGIQKRDYIPITLKVDDIKAVYKWIKTFNVPHFYFQVFFDKIYGISFERILHIISNPDNAGIIFSVESDTKKQNKTTIKISSKSGVEIADKIDEPNYESVCREMERGKLLFHVTFKGGTASLNVDNLTHILGIKGDF